MKLSEIIHELGLELQGEDLQITGCNTLEAAGPSEISFLADPRYMHMLSQSKAGAVIIDQQYAHLVPRAVLSQNPYLDFARTARLFYKPQGAFGGHSDQAYIHPEADVDANAAVQPFAYIGPRSKVAAGCQIFAGVYIGEDCTVGPNCILYPQVTLMAGSRLGKNVILHPGVVVGSDGFGFVQDKKGMEKIPQMGGVEIEDNVEIGANSCIDRATLGVTRVGAGTKTDNLVQIGHNVQTGENCIFVAQVGIGGSCKIGQNVTLAGQVGVAQHVNIGDNCRVGPKAGIRKDLEAHKDYLGVPAVEYKKFVQNKRIQDKLPQINQRLKQLEAEFNRLKAILEQGGGHG